MNTFMRIVITYYNSNPRLSNARMYLSVDSCKLEMSHDLTIRDAEDELQKLKTRLGKEPTYTPSTLNNDIVYAELYGFLD